MKQRSVQAPQAYLVRSSFRFADPTGFLPEQWRFIAKEPINKMAQRFIIREMSALQYLISSDDRRDRRDNEYMDRWDDIFENGDGFAVWLSLVIDDTCTLPFGGCSEIGRVGEDIEWINHVDAGTMMPTYDKRQPFVQVNPDNWLDRVYFTREQLKRLRVNPRPDIRFKEYQVAPTEDAFLSIEALSRIYVYYMQQLSDTPPPGILDLMDMSEDEAVAWAANFRELIEGVDTIKVPVLYEHEVPAKWISFGQSPQDLNVLEQLKRFAEMLLAKYGLSIGDLRLFEHESTKAGERVSQLVTERSGVGFWAALVSRFINRLLPDGLTFAFKQPRPEKELVEAQRKQTQLITLQAATGNKNLMDVEDAVEQAKAWELFSVDFDAPEPEPGPPALRPGQQITQEEIDGTEEARDQFDDVDLEKMVAVIKAELGDWNPPNESITERLGSLLAERFTRAGQQVTEEAIEAIIKAAREKVVEGEEVEEAVTPAASSTIRPKAALTDVVEGRVHEAFTVALDRAFQLGYLSRDARIAASSVIGDVLPELTEELLDRVTGAGAEVQDEDLRILAKSVVEKANDLITMIDALLDDQDWWMLAPDVQDALRPILEQLYLHGLNAEAGRVAYLRGEASTPYLSLAWDVTNPRVLELIETQAAEMVVNVNAGTKYYLRNLILETVAEGLSTTQTVERIQRDLFGLPQGEASKFTRNRVVSIVNYETNQAMSRAATELRGQLGLKQKQWFANGVDPCEICLDNASKGIVDDNFQYAGVFGLILHPPAHPRTCHCVVTAVMEEVRALAGPVDWPMTTKAYIDALPVEAAVQ